jgi:small subunit ribosomal protein S20
VATHRSALKASRQDVRRREINRHNRSRVKTQVKAMRAALAARSPEKTSALLPGTLSLLDRAVTLGVMHKNTAARRKSRLARQANKVLAAR